MVLGIALGLRHPVQDLERAVDIALIGAVGRLGQGGGRPGGAVMPRPPSAAKIGG